MLASLNEGIVLPMQFTTYLKTALLHESDTSQLNLKPFTQNRIIRIWSILENYKSRYVITIFLNYATRQKKQ